MKDFTVYSKYETFVNQLGVDKVESLVKPLSQSNKDALNSHFYSELMKNCYKPNDVEMLIKYDDRVVAILYVPCVDHYQKQYVVFTLFVNVASRKIIDKQCYKEAVNPMCINNTNIKDILNELYNYAQDIVEV